MTSVPVVDRLRSFLEDQQVAFEQLEHDAVFTSEEAAAVRGTTLASGAKALICKAGDQFLMFVLPADRRLDSKAARRNLKVKSLRFASREEVAQLTGLEPGSIPPFGSLFQLPTHCDQALLEQSRINFNAGAHTVSFSMTLDDYLRTEQPAVTNLTE